MLSPICCVFYCICRNYADARLQVPSPLATVGALVPFVPTPLRERRGYASRAYALRGVDCLAIGSPWPWLFHFHVADHLGKGDSGVQAGHTVAHVPSGSSLQKPVDYDIIRGHREASRRVFVRGGNSRSAWCSQGPPSQVRATRPPPPISDMRRQLKIRMASSRSRN